MSSERETLVSEVARCDRIDVDDLSHCRTHDVDRLFPCRLISALVVEVAVRMLRCELANTARECQEPRAVLPFDLVQRALILEPASADVGLSSIAPDFV